MRIVFRQDGRIIAELIGIESMSMQDIMDTAAEAAEENGLDMEEISVTIEKG